MKKISSLLLALIMLLSLCACGSTSTSDYNSAYVASDEAYYAPAQDAAALAESPVAGNLSAKGTAEETAPGVDPEKIIYSSDVTVETTDFDGSIEKLETLIKEYGAWLESSSVNNANYYDQLYGNASNRDARYTIRVPGDKFSAFVDSLSEVGNVPFSNTYTENVSSQYYDVEARLKACTTQETRLLEMMEKAANIDDVITLEDRLTELRYQIESLQSTLNNWDRQVSYSSVNLHLEEVGDYTPDTEVELSYGQRLLQALSGSFESLGEFLKDLLVFIVSILPELIFLAALFFILRPFFKKLAAKSKEKKNAGRPQSGASGKSTDNKDEK